MFSTFGYRKTVCCVVSCDIRLLADGAEDDVGIQTIARAMEAAVLSKSENVLKRKVFRLDLVSYCKPYVKHNLTQEKFSKMVNL